MTYVNQMHHLALTDYDELYAWSITEILLGGGVEVRRYPTLGAVHVYPGKSAHARRHLVSRARLNTAENLLRYRDNQTALVFVQEGGHVAAELTYNELYQQVARLAHCLRQAAGVRQGERVAGFMPNCIETVVAMLAATSLGAIWSSCSPDFGFKGVMDRFGQM